MKSKKLTRILSLVLALVFVLSIPCFALDSGDEAQTSSYSAMTANLAATGGNNYPIVLVHGLFGWGGTEIAGLNYWGGTDSLKTMLENQGYTVYTPSIGPVASNWDRACELYAYLVGGTVDYGAAHSAKNGHARYGRTFPGVLPELNDANSNLKVHLVGHSMGGETVRMLAQLLENGDPDEISYYNNHKSATDTISPLLSGTCPHWIDSITTLCTPHDGSQYDTKEYKLEPLVHQAVGIIAAASGMNINEQNFGLDFKLDQWGLVRSANESYTSYLNRVYASNIWTKHVTDLSVYDLDVDGAAVLNGYAKAQDDIYYFSIACSNTHRDPLFPHYYKTNLTMNPMMVKSGTYMGRHVNYASGHVQITPEWWENDGIVSVRSAICPHENSTDRVNLSYGTSGNGEQGTMVFKSGTQKGVWNYIEKIADTDHINVVGQSLNQKYLQDKFTQLASMLTSIPASAKTGGATTIHDPATPLAGVYSDLPAGHWAYDAMMYCAANGIMNGTSPTTMSPGATVTRAQLITMLWRMAGSPQPSAYVSGQTWYSNAMVWATEAGMISTQNAAKPAGGVTRAEIASIMYLYSKNVMGLDVSGSAELGAFPDAASVPDSAYTAMSWAVCAGLINGVAQNGTSYLQPGGLTTRGQMAAIIMRYAHGPAKSV